jgi:uncharacterized protein (TIGR04552 family)
MRQTSVGPDLKDLAKDGEGAAAVPAPQKVDSGGQASIDRMTATTLADLESMRLLLSGGSVIDWHQLAFSDANEVRRFLRVNEFDPDDPLDMERLEELRAEAVEYLTRNFNYRIPEDIAETTPAQDLLLIASQRGRHQTYACIVLKVMHVLSHLDGREALFRLPVSDDQLFGLVEAKVVSIVDEMRGAGLPIVEFAWSRKERDSLITKLLAKRDSIAAHVYDKLRFRLTTRRREDLAPVLRELLCRLVPFNYVIPGQTINRLLPFDRLFDTHPSLRRHLDALQPEEEINLGDGAINEFSARSYRVINFVADLPLRLGTVLRELSTPCSDESGFDPRAVVFVLTEFQIMDASTALTNEQGDASHAVYKERQHIEVKARLTRGMKARPPKSQPG